MSDLKTIKICPGAYKTLQVSSKKTNIPIKSLVERLITYNLNKLVNPEEIFKAIGFYKEV